MVSPSANRWGTGYGITIPAVVDTTADPSKVCAAYDASLPNTAPYTWLVASFPMQPGVHDVGPAPIDDTADTEHWAMSWKGTVTVTPGGT
jgi:hypothetical protein